MHMYNVNYNVGGGGPEQVLLYVCVFVVLVPVAEVWS